MTSLSRPPWLPLGLIPSWRITIVREGSSRSSRSLNIYHHSSLKSKNINIRCNFPPRYMCLLENHTEQTKYVLEKTVLFIVEIVAKNSTIFIILTIVLLTSSLCALAHPDLPALYPVPTSSLCLRMWDSRLSSLALWFSMWPRLTLWWGRDSATVTRFGVWLCKKGQPLCWFIYCIHSFVDYYPFIQ